VRHLVASTPCDQLRHVIASDCVNRPGSTEVVDDAGQIALGIISTTLVLADLGQ